MSKATAGDEIPKLALKHGFTRTGHGLPSGRVGFIHAERREAFLLITGEGEFLSAFWHGTPLWVAQVDNRAPGERGQDGNHLAANAKRRPVGAGDVRPRALRLPTGMEVGYLDLKRRIRNPDWIVSRR